MMTPFVERRRPEMPFLYWPSEEEVDAALAERRAGGKEGGRGLIRRKLAAAVSAAIRAGRLIPTSPSVSSPNDVRTDDAAE